jgi:hypothetical protein
LHVVLRPLDEFQPQDLGRRPLIPSGGRPQCKGSPAEEKDKKTPICR